MTDSTYHVIELIGSSSDSWELAAQNAVREAAKAYEDLRVAEVVEMDVLIENGAVIAYRTKLRLSYKGTALTLLAGRRRRMRIRRPVCRRRSQPRPIRSMTDRRRASAGRGVSCAAAPSTGVLGDRLFGRPANRTPSSPGSSTSSTCSRSATSGG